MNFSEITRDVISQLSQQEVKRGGQPATWCRYFGTIRRLLRATVEKLFEALHTTKANGMGVGLTICRSIIESCKGRLWATPNDGPGATFSFSIRVAAEPAGAPAHPSAFDESA